MGKKGRRTLRGKVSNNTRHDAEKHRSPERDKPRRGRRSDKPRDTARTPPDHGPLPREPEIQQTPRRRSHHSRQTRVPARHHSAQIRAKRAAAVKSEPSEPQQHGAEGDEGDVVRAEVEHHLLLALAEDHAVGEGGAAGGDLDGAAAGVVEHAVLVGPAVGVPDPAGDGTVDEGCPPEGEDHGGDEAAALGDGAHDDGGGDGAEHHLLSSVSTLFPRCVGKWRGKAYLVEREQQLRDQRTPRTRRAQRLHESKVRQVADKAIRRALAERQRVAPEVPLEDDDGEGAHAGPDHGQRRLAAREPGVEEAQAGDHEEDHAAGDEDEGLVAGLVPLV